MAASRMQAAYEREKAAEGVGATELVPRATVEAIVLHRDRALEAYERAYEALERAHHAFAAAHEHHRLAAPGERTRFNHHQQGREKEVALHVDLPDRGAYLARARRVVDTDVWAHVIQITDLQSLMDKQAKDELYQQLLTDPPEVTYENVCATLRQFALDAGTIFRRGVANMFSNLDRRFRSHDGWKVGSRVILNYMFDEYGSFNYHRNHRDTLRDIERAFVVLDGLKPASYGGIVELLERERGRSWGSRRQSEVRSEYFTVRCFKNGNAHIWFRRDDLLERVNQLLGEYYGAPIPEERDPDPDTGLHDAKTAVAKNYAFFPTPDAAARLIIEKAALRQAARVLEPSAGTGNLARLARAAGCVVTCVELHAGRARALENEAGWHVIAADFLTLEPRMLYDRVVMNPPWDRERDVDHVVHALEFLKPDGLLVAVMSAGTEFRETRKAAAFRELMAGMRARWTDLPERSFASVGTNANAVILRVYKDGRSSY